MPPKKRSEKSTCSVGDATKWQKMTVAQLKKACTENGLDCKGTKDSLIKTLMEFEKGECEEPPAKLKKQGSLNTQIKQALKSATEQKSTNRSYKVDDYCPIVSTVSLLHSYTVVHMFIVKYNLT